MRQIRYVKADTLIKWVGMPALGIYVICMIVAPWIMAKGDWGYVQNVWDRWQSLNVGILAFVASIVAFSISAFNENKQRARNFVAARAFLPEALSELTGYFKLSADLLVEAWQRVKGEVGGGTSTSLHATVPALPEKYKETFGRCIELAEPDVGEHLAYILMRLQVHQSRLHELANTFGGGGGTIIIPENIISYLYRLAELQALINRTFPFARGLDELDSGALAWDDFSTAYANLNIWSDQFEDLAGFTQRAIERESAN